eukprot:TRINITY_DN3200_c0_g1_i1.p1 TRINITY_DN3200_c0_g1~~TRINITY_DN3200_c0_g1_i1.p1  ORF type:complete len:421 (+),score=84.13 TRINITY_DN3200_c0_g1_i1:73-1263(+)
MAEDKAVEKARAEYEAKYASDIVRSMDPFLRLRALHDVPNAILLYEAEHPLHSLLYFKGTAVKMVLLRLDFWALFLFHCFVAIFYFTYYEHDELEFGLDDGLPHEPYWPKIPTCVVETIGGLVTFLLVFYVNQTFHRYAEQYMKCKETSGHLSEMLTLLRVHFGNHTFPDAWRVRHHLYKLLNAVFTLSFMALPEMYESGLDIWGWNYLLDNKLLTESQVQRLKSKYKVGSEDCHEEVLSWFDRGVWAQATRDRLPPKVASFFTTKLTLVSEAISTFYDYTAAPIPFQYYHLLNFVIFTYLLMLAYCFAFMAKYLAIPGFFLILVALLGLRELGNCMSNPFGHDELDLPVFDFVHRFYRESTLLIDLDTFACEPDFMALPRGLSTDLEEDAAAMVS